MAGPIILKYDHKLFILILKNFFSELIATACLLFIGCMACVHGLGEVPDTLGVALCFALALLASIQVGVHVSGGHVNPAVTLLSLFFKKLEWWMAIVYVSAQFVGAILGFGAVKILIPSNLYPSDSFCNSSPNPSISLPQAFFVEFGATFILLLVVCTAWDSRSVHHDSITLKIGFTAFSLIYAAAPYTGCSMNPARSFAPALWTMQFADLWIYMLAPMLAAGCSGALYTLFFDPILFRKRFESEEA